MIMKVLLVITAALALKVSVADARYEYNERSELTRVIAHEQLIFEDGGEPINIGFFEKEGVGLDAFYWQNKYIQLPGRYDDCVMREAVERVNPRPYKLVALDGSQYNCQNYADDLRREYFKLLSDRKIWCKCGLDNGKGNR